jgi:hypothetical protein
MNGHNVRLHPTKGGSALRTARARAVWLILTSWIACAGCATRVVVLRGDQELIHLTPGTAFKATNSGYFMSDALYLRYRQAVAAEIEKLEGAK